MVVYVQRQCKLLYCLSKQADCIYVPADEENVSDRKQPRS
jgi:hypothetical protein